MKQWKIVAMLVIFHFTINETMAQTNLPSAAMVLKEAYSRASKEHKNILLIFRASWCGWCRKMDSSLNDKTCRKFFDNNYIICHLTVDERKGNEALENPGAIEFRKKYQAEKDGIPFWMVFNKDGRLLANSKMLTGGVNTTPAGTNTGCPANKDEVNYFIRVLKKTSGLLPAELSVIATRFRKNDVH